MATINKNTIGNHRTRVKPSTYEYKKYYNNKAWIFARDVYIQEHPICECCYAHDVIKPAKVVHHKVPFSRGIDEKHKENLLLNPHNFMSLCSECHKFLHMKDSIQHQTVLNKLTDEEYRKYYGLDFFK